MEWWQDFTGWLGDHAWAGWVGLAAVLGALEVVGTELWLVMLAGGALSGALVAALGAPFLPQLGLALVVSVALLGLVRPRVLARVRPAPAQRADHRQLIGKQATVVVALAGRGPGRVEVEGQEWSALPYDEDDLIDEGARVDVVMVKDATAYVLRTQSLGG